MPLGATWLNPQLTEEAWDLAAYIDSRPRPTKEFSHDWPNLNTKAIDHPYGPYAQIEMFRRTKAAMQSRQYQLPSHLMLEPLDRRGLFMKQVNHAFPTCILFIPTAHP
ncbi:hypothetical protein GCM10023189_12280 [Nibrella saemangeumensis]|uniref:Uncharacterized protein n=1 Tax=Nibrella saemangeumensis TaxID=1084526 RepID=A0ABP8MKH0_9BACT